MSGSYNKYGGLNKNLNNFIDIKEGGNNTPDTPYGHELQYIRTASKLTNEYFDRLEEASEKGGATSIEYPGYASRST